MATPKKQRIAIIIIMIVLVIGTLGSFFVIILQTKNQKSDAQRQEQAYTEYQKNLEAYQVKVDAQAAKLSDRYYQTFSKYSDQVGKFDKAAVKKLATKELKAGEGKKVSDQTPFAVYYIGWKPSGEIFDQSIAKKALKAPLTFETGLANATVVEGWKQGLKGIKIGEVRLLTIPSDLAYGEQGSGEKIPPNTPLKFVVMAIEKPETIEQPEVPAALLQGRF